MTLPSRDAANKVQEKSKTVTALRLGLLLRENTVTVDGVGEPVGKAKSEGVVH